MCCFLTSTPSSSPSVDCCYYYYYYYYYHYYYYYYYYYQEIPQVNVISKTDLVNKEELERILDMPSATMIAGLGPRSTNTKLKALTK